MAYNKKMEIGKDKIRRLLVNIGKLILDATKLSFASLVLGTIIKGDLPHSTLILVGIISSGAGAITGIILTTLGGDK
jgi:hypothetical protein